MNITVSIDDEVLSRAREMASRRGTSVDQMIRKYLEELATDVSAETVLRELENLWASNQGNAAGRGWTREELHERSGVR